MEALTIAVEVILMIRGQFSPFRVTSIEPHKLGLVFVLYKQNRILRAVILVAFAAEVVSMIVTISFVIKGQHYTDDCIGDASPEIFVGYWCVQLLILSQLGGSMLHDSCYPGSLSRCSKHSCSR